MHAPWVLGPSQPRCSLTAPAEATAQTTAAARNAVARVEPDTGVALTVSTGSRRDDCAERDRHGLPGAVLHGVDRHVDHQRVRRVHRHDPGLPVTRLV